MRPKASLLPTAADGREDWQDEVADERLEPESGHPIVQGGLNGGLVVGVNRAHQARAGVVDQMVGRGRGCERRARRLGRGQALIQGAAHAPHPFGVLLAVEAKATGRTHGPQEPVALLPRAQELGGDADAARELPDPMSATH
jgi:hypothetical protein